MNFRIIPRSTSILIVVATIGIPGVAMANRGGGDSGDSSMNPFTGDSYAYFHGGHNLGEQGTIRPNRVTARPDASSDRHASRTPSPPQRGRRARPTRPPPTRHRVPKHVDVYRRFATPPRFVSGAAHRASMARPAASATV